VGALEACAPCDAATLYKDDACNVFMKRTGYTFTGCSASGGDTAESVCLQCAGYAHATPLVSTTDAYTAFRLPEGASVGWSCRFALYRS
jgi:hypothetical protein